jgi:hypothetical protein
MGNSVFVQIAPYLLLEYTYGGPETTFIANQVKPARIQNAYLNGQCQFLNTSPAYNDTQNVLNTSVANLGGYKWVFLNTDVPVPYINIDPKIDYQDLSGLIPSISILYDRVRVHILSGYRLDDLEGLVIQVYAREAQTSLFSVLANNVYLNSDDRDILNPKPILLGDRMYDRYVEFLIPSLREINVDFFADPTNPLSIGYQYTSNNRGFLINSSIYVKVYEIDRSEKKNGILYFYTARDYEVGVNQQDTYSLLAANVEESPLGDYFLYYPTYAGNYIEDFLADLNDSGGDYVVINDIDIYEQVGLDQILTFSFSQVQQSNFDRPLEFRPILKYADSAASFSIDYTVRIFNKLNAFQLIRRSSTTSFFPRKYGKQLEKIALAQQSYPLKVYNKVYGNSPVSFIGNDYAGNFSTVYVPVYYEVRNIVTQVKTVLATGADPLSPDFYDNVNFGQGDARIYLSDFDSYYKFSVGQVDPKTGTVIKIDLSSSEVQISFKDNTGKMIMIPAQASTVENAKADGELVFQLPGNLRSKVLFDNEIKSFYLASVVDGSSTTILYTGTVDRIENIGKEITRTQEIVSTATTNGNVTSTVANATAATTATGTAAATTATSTSAALNNTQGALVPGKSILQTLTDSNSEAVNSVGGNQQTQPVTIPGFSVDEQAASVKNGIKPVSLEKNTAAQQSVINNLSQSSGTDINLKGT